MRARILRAKLSLKVSLSILLVISSLVFSFQIPRVHAAADFSISANPQGLGPMPAGNTTSSIISIVSTGGFIGTVSLRMNTTAPFASLSSTSVTLSGTGTASSTLMVTVTNPGVYSINVTASANTLSHSLIISIVVVGEICLADPSFVASLAPGSNPCPATPYVFNGPVASSPAPNQIRMGVYIWKSQPFNAFSISLRADHTILAPTGANLTGSVLPGSALVVGECVGGVAKTAGHPCSSTDGPDTLSFAAAGFPGLSKNPTIGLLFTAVYNITGSTGSSGMSLGFQTGCNSSSASNFCVVVANGDPSGPVTELVQNSASFKNNSQPPHARQDFDLSISKSSLGPLSPSVTDRSVTVTITPVNSFVGTVSLAATIFPSSGLVANLSPATVAGSGASTLMLSPSSSGTYSVNVTGTSGAITHFRLVTVTVTSSSPSGTSPLISPAILYSIIGVVFVIGLAGLFLVLVRRKPRG